MSVWITIDLLITFLYVPTTYYIIPHFPPLNSQGSYGVTNITHTMTHTILEQLIPQLEIQEDKKVITITDEGGEHLGLLYYELAKKGFTNKPIGLNKWGMVECKIERLYEKYPEIEPLDVLRWGTQIANPQR